MWGFFQDPQTRSCGIPCGGDPQQPLALLADLSLLIPASKLPLVIPICSVLSEVYLVRHSILCSFHLLRQLNSGKASPGAGK